MLQKRVRLAGKLARAGLWRGTTFAEEQFVMVSFSIMMTLRDSLTVATAARPVAKATRGRA